MEGGQTEQGYQAATQRAPRPFFTAVALFTLGVMVGYMLARPRIMWPEIVLVLVVAALLLPVPQRAVERVDWRPWRRPSPIRSTVSIALLLIATVTLVLGWIHGGSAWFPIWMTLMFAHAVVQPGPVRETRRARALAWALRGLWGLLAIASWWDAYRSLSRLG